MNITYLKNDSDIKQSYKPTELNIAAVTIDQMQCNPMFKKVLSESYYIFNDRVRISNDGRIELNPNHKDRS